MILGHDPKPNNHPAVSDPRHGQQLPTVTQQTPVQVARQSNQTQPMTLEPMASPNGTGDHPRVRSKKPAPQRTNTSNGDNIITKPYDPMETPLPYSIKPARQTRRQRLPASTHPSAASSGTVMTPVQPSTGRISQERHPNEPPSYRPGTGERKVQTVHSNYRRPSQGVQPGQAPFPPQTNFQRGTSAFQPQNPQYGRPPPHHQQLYNPYTASPSAHQQPWFHRAGPNNQPPSQAVIQAQIAYLDSVARVEIPKVEMSLEEEQQKEMVRTVLEDICQRVITEYEIERNPLFDGSSVRLTCYGSLSTGFATQSSDMDLAFESPLSIPEASSIESEIPRLLEKALLDLGYGARLLTKTRIPLIRFCEKPTPELAIRLLQERQKWEKERDSPPKATKIKMEPDKESKLTETNEALLPTVDGISVDDTLDDGVIPEGGMPLAEIIDETPASVSQPSDLDTGKGKPNSSTDATEGPLTDSVNGLQKLAVTDAKKQREEPKERREAVLPDEELVRLYKIAIHEGWFEPHERKILYNYFKAVEHSKNTEQLAECKAQLFSLPDVLNRYRPPPSHQLDYPTDTVGIQCDIIFSNPLAIQNSAMLKCYNLSDPRVKPMVLFIKAWAKRRKINSPYHGTLSSYGYVLMVLHYLVNVAKPPICLNLQTVDMAARDASVENTRIIDGYPVRFWRDKSEIQHWAQNGLITQDRHSTVGCLLRGFFQYFALPSGGFSWGMDVLSLRSPGGIISKSEKGWVAAKTEVLDPSVEGQRGQEVRHRYLFSIEDPFEIHHNIARTVVHNGIVAIRDEFRRAHRLILEAGNGRVTEDLFGETASKNDLNYRYFGPRPRPPVNKDVRQDAKSKVGQSNTEAPGPKHMGNIPKAAGRSLPNNSSGKNALTNVN